MSAKWTGVFGERSVETPSVAWSWMTPGARMLKRTSLSGIGWLQWA